MIQFELPQHTHTSIIKVIGVGGGGGNAVNYMYSLGLDGVDFIVCNTDQKALHNSPVPTKIQLGPSLTKGLGAGANPEIGQKACQESIEEIKDLLSNNTKMVFVTAGMGGGTGTGGAPIVAKVAKEQNILTVGIVTTPFSYEGKRRMKQAEEGIKALRDHVDTILVISNDKLRHQFGNIPTSQAFSRADDILATATKCITDVINSQGHIMVDFADVCTVMRDGGVAILGSATASGENRAYEAVEQALNSPLLNDNNIKGAKWVLLNINSAHGTHEHTLDEVEMIQAYVQEQAGEDCDVIFGTGFDDNLEDKISVTIIATGFEYKQTEQAYSTGIKKPYSEKNKIVYTLEEDEAINSELVNEAVPVASEEPTMYEVEPPAIPSMLAFGLAPAKKVVDTVHSAETYSAEENNHLAPQAAEEKIVFELYDEEIDNNEMNDNEPQQSETISEETTSNSIQAELDNLFAEPLKQVEKTEQQMQDEYVTIKGITLCRRKGGKLLTDSELEAEANFELQKRAFDERASKLRSMSFNVHGADIDKSESDVPAYLRQGKSLEEHTASNQDVYSALEINEQGAPSTISTLNNFLNGKKPD